MRRRIYICFLALAATAHAGLLDDIVAGKYKAQKLEEYTAMADGQHYAQLSESNVLAYSYQTGNVTDTLFCLERAKGAKLDTIEGFVLSPDENFLLVYNNVQKIFRRSFSADYYLYNRHKNTLSPLSETMPLLSPVFSPNGKYIAFSRQNNLFIHKLDFGTEVAVTTDGKPGGILNGTADWMYEEEFGITAMYSFSPDSKQLAFVRIDESEVASFTWQEMLHQDTFPRNKQLKYPRAGQEISKVQAVVYDTYYKSLKTMQLPEAGECYIPRIRWTNSSDGLAIFRLNRHQNKLEMFVANPKSTVSQRCYFEEYKKAYVDYEQIDEWQFLQDNSFIAVNETDGYRHAYLYSAVGNQLRQLTKGNFDVTRVYGYDEKNKVLYFQAADRSPMERNIYALNIKNNKLQALTIEKGWHEADFSTDYAYFINHYSSVRTPDRYTLYTKNGKKVRELLTNDALQAEFAALNLPEKKFFSFTTDSGDELNGWMVLPVNFDDNKQYPVLQVQYSGPNSQQVTDKWKVDWEYYWATQGVITVCVDGRGTGARGRDWRMQTYMNIGVMEAHDQVQVARYMQRQPYVDKDRIAIWGWSYGGFMTLMAMSEPAAPFRCGIAVAPVTDYRLYDAAYTERFMRTPQANERGYDDCSLPKMAERLQGHLLIVHGLADDNVHCQNTWNYIDALVQAEKQFEMQIYPDDNHFLKQRKNYRHLYERMRGFLQRWLIDK